MAHINIEYNKKLGLYIVEASNASKHAAKIFSRMITHLQHYTDQTELKLSRLLIKANPEKVTTEMKHLRAIRSHFTKQVNKELPRKRSESDWQRIVDNAG